MTDAEMFQIYAWSDLTKVFISTINRKLMKRQMLAIKLTDDSPIWQLCASLIFCSFISSCRSSSSFISCLEFCQFNQRVNIESIAHRRRFNNEIFLFVFSLISMDYITLACCDSCLWILCTFFSSTIGKYAQKLSFLRFLAVAFAKFVRLVFCFLSRT